MNGREKQYVIETDDGFVSGMSRWIQFTSSDQHKLKFYSKGLAQKWVEDNVGQLTNPQVVVHRPMKLRSGAPGKAFRGEK